MGRRRLLGISGAASILSGGIAHLVDAMVKIRPLSGGAKSLTISARSFTVGPWSAPPTLKPYTFEDFGGRQLIDSSYDWPFLQRAVALHWRRRMPSIGRMKGSGWN